MINREAHFYKKYIEANQATMEYTDNILENKRGDYGKKKEEKWKDTAQKKLGYKSRCLLKKNGKVVGRYSKRIKTKIFSIIKATTFSECELKVVYDPIRDAYNSGTFFNKKDAIQALRDWTEKELLDFVEESNWGRAVRN